MYRWLLIPFFSLLLLICVVTGIYTTFSLSSSPIDGDIRRGGKLDDKQAVWGIVEALNFFAKDKGNIWPGYTPDAKPMIITFDNGHIYGFGLSTINPVWEILSIQGRTIHFTTNDQWGVRQVQSQADFLVDGEPTFVYHLDLVKDNRLEPFLVLLHENFLAFQTDAFKDSGRNGSYADHFNFENIALMHIEEMILADFMNGLLDDAKSAFHKTTALKDYLAVNQIRRKLLQPHSLDWELERQRKEGMADYVAITSLDQFPLTMSFDGVSQLLSTLQASTVNEEIFERTIHWRHHSVGAALGTALDFLEISGWKKRITETGISPSELLEDNLVLESGEVAERMEKVKKRYGYDNVMLQVTLAMHHYQDEISDLINEYDELDGIELMIAKPENAVVECNGSSLYEYYLEDGSILSLADTSSQFTPDRRWLMEIEGAPMVKKRMDGGITLKLEPDAEIILNGKTMTLSQLKKENNDRSFDDIAIKSHHCAFVGEQLKGRLLVGKNTIKIIF